ncbi:MAG: integrase core domain-containing protein [candidate division WOR-3 bacterium]|nr:integrase core domain-containing protein [candidate division WOR-3 bacterium]
MRRHQAQIKELIRSKKRKKEKRECVDWYSAKPFEIVQIDVKHIRDQKALTIEQIIHLDTFKIPNYQWSALDVNSRFKLIAYSQEKSWINGLFFYFWVISWLRSHRVKCQIIFTVDNGEEFGGRSWLKVKELRKLLIGFGCRLVQNHKGHPEESAHLERSHRTDDEEFYIPRVFKIKSEAELLTEGLRYNYYYNNYREHSALDFKTPFEYLKEQMPDIDDNIRKVVPIMLDKVAVELGPWSGYHVLAPHRKCM